MPDPRDPSDATMAAIKASNDATMALIEARFDALEKASVRFYEDLVRVPTQLDRAMAAASAFQDERHANAKLLTEAHFQSNREKIIANAAVLATHETNDHELFASMENRSLERAATAKAAVEASFAANALAAQKMESAFTKNLDQLGDRVSDLKERLIAQDGKSSVQDPATRAALTDLSSAVARLSANANIETGKSKQADDNSTKIFALAAIAVSFGTLIIDAFWLHSATGH